jgi:hypothetical protein
VLEERERKAGRMLDSRWAVWSHVVSPPLLILAHSAIVGIILSRVGGVPMRCILWVLALILVGGSCCLAGDVIVSWKANKAAGVVESENKLPNGATIKIRVSYLDETRTMKVNGREFKLQKKNDKFTATVGTDGKITISVPGLTPIGQQIDGSLYFQKSGTTGTGLIVTVED